MSFLSLIIKFEKQYSYFEKININWLECYICTKGFRQKHEFWYDYGNPINYVLGVDVVCTHRKALRRLNMDVIFEDVKTIFIPLCVTNNYVRRWVENYPQSLGF